MRLLLAAWLLVGCAGPTTLAEKMDHAEEQGRRAEAALDQAEKEVSALEVDAAARNLGEAERALADPEITKYPEHRLLKERLAEDRRRLEEARAVLAQRELERAVQAQRQVLEVSAARLEGAAGTARKPEAGASELEELDEARADLTDKLEDAVELERKDAELLRYTISLRKKLTEAEALGAERRRVLAFVGGPLQAKKEAAELLGKAAAEADPEAARGAKVEALARLRSCADGGRAMLLEDSALARARVALDGKVGSVEQAVTACAREAAELEKKLKAKVKKGRAPVKKKAKKKR